jgi:anti-sigma regulatory factor (Ser/Thr protein kinase)
MPFSSGATLELPADVRGARDKLEEFLSAADWLGDVNAILIAVQEALINAERHGGGLREVRTRLRGGVLEVQVADRGAPFDPAPYTAHEPDLLAERGRGWWLISQITADYQVAVEPQGCRVHLVFSPETRVAPAPGAAPAVPAISDLGADVIVALDAVGVMTDAHLVVREVVGDTASLFGLSPGEIVGRDLRGYAAEIKDRFADPGRFEDRLLASYAHLDRTVVELFHLADGRTVRRHGVPITRPNGAAIGRLGIYVPVADRSGLIGGTDQ